MNNSTRLLAVITAVVFLTVCGISSVSEESDADTWDGTAIDTWYVDKTENSYTIDSASELAGLASLVDKGESFSGKTVTLTTDLDLSGHEWNPIGDGTRSSNNVTGNIFQGTFDGGGHTISGLTIDASGGEGYGLFSFLTDVSSVKNLYLSGVSINAGESVGALVGAMDGGSITNVHVAGGSIIGTKAVGGIVGRIVSAGTIENCENKASINATDYNAGGIAGAAYYANNGMFLNNCENSGPIESKTCAGGIVGLSSANLLNCENSGSVSVTKSGATSIGGIVGEQKNDGSVIGCTNEGDVSNITAVDSDGSTDKAGVGTGGIVGWIRYSDEYSHGHIVVRDCVNSGNVSSSSYGVGGIVGLAYHSFTVTGCTSSGTITGTNMVAGIVGGAQAAAGDVCCSEGCYMILGGNCADNVTLSYSSTAPNHGEIIGHWPLTDGNRTGNIPWTVYGNTYTDSDGTHEFTMEGVEPYSIVVTTTDSEGNQTDSYYRSLSDAFSSVTGAATVTIHEDITGETPDDSGEWAFATVPSGADITLDLNGHDITVSLHAIWETYGGVEVILNNGGLTIVDESGRGSIGGSSDYGCTATIRNVGEGSVLVIESGNITMSGANAIVNSDGKVTVNGGTVSTTGQFASFDNGTAAIHNRGVLEINGGTISTEYQAPVWYGMGSEKPATVTINGGTLTSVNSGMDLQGNDGTVTITGGQFHVNPADYLSSGYGVRFNDAYYVVVIVESTTTVDSFEDLKAALEEAETVPEIHVSGTVTVTENITIGSSVTVVIDEGSTLAIQNAIVSIDGFLINQGTLDVTNIGSGFVDNMFRYRDDGDSISGLIEADEDGVYTIYTAADLQLMHYVMLRDADERGVFSGKVELAADIDLSGYRFMTLGFNGLVTFGGTFDGNGHDITGMTIDYASGYLGLFSVTENATFKDFDLLNVNLTTQSAHMGAITGCSVDSGTFMNITISGEYYNAGSYYCGGWIGFMDGNEEGRAYNFLNCVNETDVTGCFNVGAFWGSSSGCTIPVVMIDCSNEGDVTATGGTIGIIGGFVQNSGTVYNFNNTGTITNKDTVVENPTHFSGKDAETKTIEGGIVAVVIGSDGKMVPYTSMALAVGSAHTDGTQVTILALVDLTDTFTVPSGANIILQLDGNDITADTAISNAGTLGIAAKDSVVTGEIKNSGTLTIESGSFSVDISQYVSEGTVAIKNNDLWVVDAGATVTFEGMPTDSLISIGETAVTGSSVDLFAGEYTVTVTYRSFTWSRSIDLSTEDLIVTMSDLTPVVDSGYTIDYAGETVQASQGYELSMDGSTGSAGPATVVPGSVFYIRTAADGDVYASAWAEVQAPSRPVAPTIDSSDYNAGRYSITAADGLEISLDGGSTWSASASNLSSGTTYSVMFRSAATSTGFASVPTDAVSIRTTSPSSGGGSITPPQEPEEDTETVTNPDGSTTTTTTRPDGSSTVTTVWPDGSETTTDQRPVTGGTQTTVTDTDSEGNTTTTTTTETETITASGDSVTSTTVEHTDSEGNTTVTTESTYTSESESTVTQATVTTDSEGNKTATTSTTVTVVTSDEEAVTITNETISDAVAQIEDTSSGADTSDNVIRFQTTGDTQQSVNVILEPEAIQSIADISAQVEISGGVGSITTSNDVIQSLTQQPSSVNIIIQVADVSQMAPVQQDAVQNSPTYELLAISNGEEIHELNGTVTVSVPYTLSEGELEDSITVYFVDDDGQKHAMPTTYSGGIVTFTTTHFSYYTIQSEMAEPAPVPSEEDDNTLTYVGIAIVIVVVIIVAAVAIRHRA